MDQSLAKQGAGSDQADSISSSLLDRIKVQDPEAWRRLVRLYGPVVYGWCRQLGLQPADAADILAWRHQVLADLTSKGVLSPDVFPEEMTAPLVNSYLEIKARHLL